MRRTLACIAILSGVILATCVPAAAQGPMGRSFGFGLILGDPTGGTVKFWLNRENAIDAYIGGDYFGGPRIGADYLWHFNAFNSGVVNMYAGPGIAFGFGEGRIIWFREGHDAWFVREAGGTGVAVRAIIGINVVPRRTPLEIFLEAGPLIGVSPAFGVDVDFALGIRFYP